jgi:hypothetical protein
LRQTWGRLVHKQWLILYPLALGLVNLLAFLAVYAAAGERISWSPFFKAGFDRWQFVYDRLLASFSLTSTLAVALAVGLGLCVLTAMIRAPFFRAIAGPGYPLAPRHGREAAWLTSVYVFTNMVLWVLPFAGAGHAVVGQLIAFVTLVVAILLAFADYVVVFEQAGFVKAVRRSVLLVGQQWAAVIVVCIVLQLVYFGLHELYRHFYDTADGVLIALPVIQIFLDAFVVLLFDLVLIFLYEHIRRGARRG